jgi:hypothetical protein
MTVIHYIGAILLFNVILTPLLLIIIVASNLFWIVTFASMFGRYMMNVVYAMAFVLASGIGFSIIYSAQQPHEKSSVQPTEDTRDDCERHPGIYGC